jgi:hypothetical protein
MTTTKILRLAAVLTFGILCLSSSDAFAQSGPYEYFPLTPCRVVDTRGATGVNGGPILTTATRNFQIRGNCGVPTTARAVSLNVTVTGASSSSWLTIWPSGTTKPFVSAINFEPADLALANGIIVGLSTATQDLSVANAVGTVHVILDVNGYFQ